MIRSQYTVTPRRDGATYAPPPAEPLLERMTAKIVELGMNGTAVTADALFENSDFTRDEIRTHAAEAADLARARAVRQLA